MRDVPDICGIVGTAPDGKLIVMPTKPLSLLDVIFSAPPISDGTAYDDGWMVASGTSSAAPMVAGVAAILIQGYKKLVRSSLPIGSLFPYFARQLRKILFKD